MTPKRALEILDQIASQAAMKRESTMLAMEAVHVLDDLISVHPVEEVKKPVTLTKGEPKNA